jgi:hypothetical protein
VSLPIQKPTSCTFGGDSYDTIFVTSACIGLSEVELKEQPLAGCVFRVSAGFQEGPTTFSVDRRSLSRKYSHVTGIENKLLDWGDIRH